MKELNTFRQFLAEEQINENLSPLAQALIKVYEEEIEAEKAETGNDDVGLAIQAVFRKGIEMLKNGEDPESVNDKVQGLYIKATGDYSYDPNLMMDVAKEMTKEGSTNEGEEINEQKLDIDKPGNPLYDLNNNDTDVMTLNALIDKYGLEAVQLWVTSGEYSKSGGLDS